MSQLLLSPQWNTRRASPIVKWAGGKGALLAQFKPFFPKRDVYYRYFEPFAGGAAIFFYLQPDHSFLYDLNPHLIEVYTVVRDDVDNLIVALKEHYNDRDYFYAIRAQQPAVLTPVQRAARFIFLNRTCYNGLYRVNRQDQFNVPFGKYKNPTICDEHGLRLASQVLQHTQLNVADFEAVLDIAESGDFLYFDPPYEPLSHTSNFTSYTSNGFTRADQHRLAATFRTLDARGCLLMLSNSNTPLIHELYQGFSIHLIKARRAINSNPNGRGVIQELLITNLHYCPMQSAW
ncbi:MAG: DNA adenine methylase [Chloroflexaceae bacterium]|nr:DNA adenine methylase [Chloroflexaceae bacterium]